MVVAVGEQLTVGRAGGIKLGSFQVQTYSIKEFLVVGDVTLFEFFVSEVGKVPGFIGYVSMYGAPSFTGCLSNPL